jgi:hypothetical protein
VPDKPPTETTGRPGGWAGAPARSLAGRLALAVLSCALSAQASGLSAQDASTAAPGPSDATITLTKNVEVFAYEDLTFTVESYTVSPGDNLEGILKSRGLWPARWTREREAQLMRLVAELNPAVANLDLISPGQFLYLPNAQAPPEPEPELGEVETVVAYELSSQPGQAPARVVVRRAGAAGVAAPTAEEPLPEGTFRLDVSPAEGEGPPGLEDPAAAARASAAEARVQASASASAAQARADASVAAQPEGGAPDGARARRGGRGSRERRARAPSNEGELSTAPDGTVYRTVRVRQGDTVERLLRREGLDPDLIYRHLIKLTAEINPGLRNPNMIIAGATLRIPAQGAYLAAYTGGDYTEPVLLAQADSGTASDATVAPDAPGAGGRRAPRRRAPATPPAAPSAAPGKYRINTRRLPPAPLPTADSQNARQVLSLIFSRLGEDVSQKGRVFLPLDEPPHFDVDASAMPVVNLKTGRHIILDLGRSLSQEFIDRFRRKYPEYMVFQPGRGEGMDKALDRLWPMCGYYRVYGKDRAFEGGRDVKIRIAADWLVWPTATDWNRGQPVVVNLAPAPDDGTPLPWVRFLADHNISVVDLYKGEILAGGGKAATPVNNFLVVDAGSDNPSAFAEALVKALGFSPRIGVRVDLAAGRIITGGETIGDGPPPAVFWEAGDRKTILEYGDLSTDDLNVLRANGFTVISSAKDSQSVLKSILAALDIKLGGPLVLNGDSTGGPSIKLTIEGQTFPFGDRTYLFTSVALPSNMNGLDPNQTVVVLKYRGASPPVPAAQPAPPGQGEGAGPEGVAPPDVISEDI